ncbi:MAG: hypothetical protein CVV24_06170 [Ignavibacteriae bacterium HGW-Ignavibacteriae-3]|nr:MAG: hypothetical protein CVV24_06170 [Ignavibacteriae bacterium HGW-Ignavibacteriae-3]
MGKIGFIDYKGFKILLFDFSYLNNSKEILEFIKEAGLIARKQVLKSVLVVTDVTEAHYNIEVTQAMKELAKGNAPYIKASAVVGVTGLKKILYDAVIKFSGRDIKIFDNRESAMEWLITHK